MPIFTRRSRARTFQITSARLSKNGTVVTFASNPSCPRHTSTSRHGWLRRCGGFVFWFLRMIVTLICTSLRTLAFFFPLVTGTFSSFNANDSLFDPWPRLLFQFSRAWRQSFSIWVSDLCFFPPSFFQFLTIGHRYLQMNLHVVQFQYSFELRGLTYSQFVQTFPDIIRWDLRHTQKNFVPSCIEFLNIIVVKSNRESISVI